MNHGQDLPPRLLQEFLVLSETRDLDRAADRLGVTPDTLTKSMRRLERQLGTRLFAHGKHVVRLTPAGDALMAPAQRVVSAAGRFMAGMRAADGPLRVAHASSVDTLAVILDRFAERRPDVRIDERVLPCTEQRRALNRREIDVAVCRVVGVAPDDCHAELIRLDPIMAAIAPSPGVAPCFVDPTRTAASVGDTGGEWSTRDELIASYERAANCELRRVGIPSCAGQESATLERSRAPVFLTMSSSRPAPAERRLVGLVPLQPYFPWSVVWPMSSSSSAVVAFVETARAVAADNGWLSVARLPGKAWLPQNELHAPLLEAPASRDAELPANVSEIRPPATAAGSRRP